MKKADISVQTLFIIAVTVIFLFFAIALFMGWIKLTDNVTNPILCNTKLLSFCSDWSKENYQKVPYEWADKAPGCAKKGIIPSLETCKDLLQQK
jgi:hypothetical protein